MNTLHNESSADRREFFVRVTTPSGEYEDDGRGENGYGELTEAEAIRRATTPGQYAQGCAAEVVHWA